MGISVIIPLFNRENYIGETIDSVLNQSFTDFEIIIVDDGSTDKSIEIVQSFHDSRIQWITQCNQGVSCARNNGVKIARHDLIAFLDSDDQWEKDFLHWIDYLSRNYPEARMYGTNLVLNYQNTGKLVKLRNKLPDNWEGLIHDNFGYQKMGIDLYPSAFAIQKKTFVESGGFCEGDKLAEDLTLFFKVLTNDKLAYKNIYLATICKDVEGQATSKNFHISEDGFLNYLEHAGTHLEKKERRFYEWTYDRRLIALVFNHIIALKEINQDWLKLLKSPKGKIYGGILLFFSLFPITLVNHIYQLTRTVKKKLRA